MGKLYLGILGGFTGTVGTVVGSSNRKGEDIIRAKTKRTRSVNSESQLQQQTKFSLVTQFMQPLNFLLKNSFSQASGIQMTPYNYACQYALKNAITGDAPDFELDYSKIQISQGLLAREAVANAQLVDNKISFIWDDVSANGSSSPKDKAVMLVYNVDKGEVSYSCGSLTREAKAGVLALPYTESGDKLLFYLFFHSESDQTLVSTSQFLGSVVIE